MKNQEIFQSISIIHIILIILLSRLTDPNYSYVNKIDSENKSPIFILNVN